MVLVVLAVLLATRTAWAQDPRSWELVEAVAGVQVWSAEAPDGYWGHARGTVEAPASVIFERVSNFESLPRMYPWLGATHVIARTAASATVHFLYDLPWPLADREFTAAHRWWRDPSGTLTLTAEDAGAVALRGGDTVHVAGFLMRMTFVPIRDGAATDVDYVLRADLGGRLPRSVRVQTAWKIPMNAILSMRRSLEGVAPPSATRTN
jgi:hypothetical protein